MTFSPFHSVGAKQKNSRYAGVHRKLYYKKLHTRYNKGVQANCKAKGVKIWRKRHIVYHTQTECVNITLCSPLSIDEK